MPAIADEFSYLLLSNALAHGGVFETPSIPQEFIETPHVLTSPVYTSKYLPAQSAFMAVGEALVHKPIWGVWMSAALASAAVAWMLAGYFRLRWAVVGTVLFVLRYAIYSYWSQTYWGGMVPAAGGMLVLGALPRLLAMPGVRLTIVACVGGCIIMASRPVAGAVMCLALITWLFVNRRCTAAQLIVPVVLGPVLAIMSGGALLLGAYNRVTTGVAWIPPYAAHEAKYQTSPPLLFLPERDVRAMPSALGKYYDLDTMQFRAQRSANGLARGIQDKLAQWWGFYWGVPLSIPLILVTGNRRFQVLLTAVWSLLWIPAVAAWSYAGFGVAVIGACQTVLLYRTLPVGLLRFALVTSVVVLAETLCLKWPFPHYFAPATGATVLVQTWALSAMGAMRRRSGCRFGTGTAARGRHGKAVLTGIVWIEVLTCVGRVGASSNSAWRADPKLWSLGVPSAFSRQRQRVLKALEGRRRRQVVFVHYSADHDVREEWIYNHADVNETKVLWVRELDQERDRQLMQAMADRDVWVVDADNGGRLRPLRILPDEGENGEEGDRSPALPW